MSFLIISINLFCCLEKGVYPFEYMDEWEKFNVPSLPEKEESYSNLNMGDITDADYMHAKEFVKTRKLRNWENVMICILTEIHYS